MKVKSALAALPLVLNACGSEEASTNYTPNELGQGIWEGGFSNSPITVSSASGSVTQTELTQIEQSGVGLYTSDNRAFFYNIDDEILFTYDTPGIGISGLSYSPFYYTDGDARNTVSFNGTPTISTSIIGNYSGDINANYVLVFDDKYFQGADLNRLVGMWSYTEVSSGYEWNLDIASDGGFTGTMSRVTGCTFSGDFSTIDPTKNEYGISVTLDINCAPYDGTYTGLAATIDTDDINDTLLIAIYQPNFGDHGFFMKPVKQP